MTKTNRENKEIDDLVNETPDNVISENNIKSDNAEKYLDQEKQIEALETLTAELKEKYIRAIAETENVRKRAQREKEDAINYGITGIASDIIIFVDNLERAICCLPKLNDATSQNEVTSFINGIKIILQDVVSTLEKHGIKKIESKGKPFDPRYHQAVAQVEGNGEQGIIMESLQEGYLINDRLLRAAMVTVSR